MFKSDNALYQRLLIFFASAIVILIIITLFIPSTFNVAEQARIKMLRLSQYQFESTNRMLFSRANIANLALNDRLDASLIDDDYEGGVLIYGEMLASIKNIYTFINIDKLLIEEDRVVGKVILYPRGLRGKACFLEYYQPQVKEKKSGELYREKAHYKINIKDC